MPPLILNGTTGVSGVDGSAGTPSYQGGDTNTGIFYPAADTIAFAEGGAEVMRIDSSGNVQIGTTTGSDKLTVSGAIAARRNAGGYVLKFLNSSSSDDLSGFIYDNNQDNIEITAYDPSYALAFKTNNTERMRIDSSGRVGIGTTPSAWGSGNSVLDIGASGALLASNTGAGVVDLYYNNFFNGSNSIYKATGFASYYRQNTGDHIWYNAPSGTAGTTATFTERMRIDSSGILYFGTTTANPPPNNVYGVTINASTSSGVYAAGVINASANGSAALSINRGTDDGTLVNFYQAGTVEGSITVSGSTVSYNGGHLSRWSQLPNNQKDDTLLKGTVMSNLDDMCVWTKDGTVLDNEQLNKMKVSDVDGDINVAGVFVNWDNEDVSSPIDMNVAMTGDMIIRIAEGVVVQKGDLLMSAGDGTAKPQGDDIVRSKTVAKVTSNHVTCTYADGSYCVPCVLMAC